MDKLKIISFKTASAYHLAGSLVRLEWEVQGHLFIILRVGYKIKLFRKTTSADLFLYSNKKAKLYAVNIFSFNATELNIIIHNTNKSNNIYRLKDNQSSIKNNNIELNTEINSSRVKDMNVSFTNIHFNVKDIKLNQTL